MNNINCVTEEKNKCFGCRACYNICPVKAITMQEDGEGFFYPVIDSSKCTSCGLCKNSCPSLEKSETYNNNGKNPDCYAVMADDETRFVSSSGGAFTLIANYILEKGGYVCGAAFVGQNVRHIIIDKKEDMYKLRGSKYVQSDTNTVYSQIKDLLKLDKFVLFTGTPCQVAGLYNFLGKNYDKLYTVDLICHGVPPQKVFDVYLKETLQKDDVFANCTFRDKKAGWTVHITTTTADGKIYFGGGAISQNAYLQAFLKNMCLRPSCGTCPFTSTQREADITIGDFWAIERFDKSLNDNKGTSVILLNSKKGHDIFNNIQNICQLCRQVPLEYASYYNITLKTPLKQHPNRQAFFRLMNEGKTLKEITEYCNRNQYDTLILNFWPFQNMGGVLLAWALQQIIKSFGYTSALINFKKYLAPNQSKNCFVERFAEKYLQITKEYNSLESLFQCNELSDSVILGSDCIWGNWWEELTPREIYCGSFINENKKKISYAPSFGNKDLIINDEDKQVIRYWLQKIDYCSVRETSGVEILKGLGINAEQVLDPTLLLKEDDYAQLCKQNDFNKKEDYVFNYSIGVKEDDEAYKQVMSMLSDVNIQTLDQSELDSIDIEDWLCKIKDCKLLITNSYHACCFAIIFKVPFLIFTPYGLDTSRFDSLLGMLNLQNRILRSIQDVDKFKNLFEPIDWERVNSILEKEKQKSLKWFKNALESPKDLSKVKPEDAIIQNINFKFIDLEAKYIELKNKKTISPNELQYAINYKKNYRKYLKYKILKNFVFGKTKQRYKEKQAIWHEKIRIARRLKGETSAI